MHFQCKIAKNNILGRVRSKFFLGAVKSMSSPSPLRFVCGLKPVRLELMLGLQIRLDRAQFAQGWPWRDRRGAVSPAMGEEE